MSLKTLQSSFHAQFLNFRNTHYLVSSDNFSIAWGSATEAERKQIEGAIKRTDKNTIRKFIQKQLNKLTPFHSMGIKKLREIGRNVRIPEYWKKDKSTLIEEIENVVARLKKSSQ